MNFKQTITNLFNVDRLCNVHNLLDLNDINNKLFSNKDDSSTMLHSMFYKKLNEGWPEFMNMYKLLINSTIMDIYNVDTIIYQAKPTFRVQLPNNIAVGGNSNDSPERYGWHKDSDPKYDHPIVERNFILPLTTSQKEASVYIETAPHSNEFSPARMNTGEIFSFFGGECIHGNKPNITGKSRVSFDFRIILKKDYNENFIKKSNISNQKFVIGEYYEMMKR